jgi:hypothetical protein
MSITIIIIIYDMCQFAYYASAAQLAIAIGSISPCLQLAQQAAQELQVFAAS